MPATLTVTLPTKTERSKKTSQKTSAGRGHARFVPEGWPAWLWQHIARPAPDSLRVMYRHVLTPWYWGVGVYGATAAYTAMAVDAGMAPAATALVAATTAGTAANLLPRLLRGKKASRRWPVAADWVSREPGHARVAANVGAAYATAVATIAPSTPEGWTVAGAAGVLTLMGCSARYWQHHRHHTTVVRPGAAAPVSTVDETSEQLCARVRARWASRVGCEGGILPGSILRISPAPAGARGTIVLVAGKHDLSSVTSVLGRISSALGVAKKYLVIDDYEPEDGSEPDPAVLSVEIMSARVRSQVYKLGDYQLVRRRGDLITLTVGGVVDGSEMAEWLLYDDSGIRHGYITGATGAGKSVLMDTLVIGALETGVTSILYIDPKGNSSPRIAKHAHVAVVSEDPRRWHRVLDGVLEGMAIRKALVEAGIINSSRFVPTPEFPGVLIAIDEIHRLTRDPDILDKLLDIAREGRSLGFGLLLASQGYTAGDWGGSTIFRAQVTSANAIALKLDKDQGNSYFQDFGINPNKVLPDPNFVRKLPDGSAIKPYAGFAVSKALGQVPLRSLFDDEDGREQRMAAAKAKAAVRGMDVETYGAIDTGSGHLLSRADTEREQMRAAAAERVAAARRAGQAALAGNPQPVTAAARAAAVTEPATRPTTPGRPMAPIIDLDALRNGVGRTAQPAASTAGGTTAEKAVLALLAEGPHTRAQLIRSLAGREGCGETAVKGALKSLAGAGRVERTRESQKAPYVLTH